MRDAMVGMGWRTRAAKIAVSAGVVGALLSSSGVIPAPADAAQHHDAAAADRPKGVMATEGRQQTQPPANAQPEPRVLPDVALTPVGGTAGARALPTQGRWLLLHMQLGCAPCKVLLTRIQTDAPAIAPRLAIVVSGASSDDVGKMMAEFQLLESATWYADEIGGMAASMRIDASPVVLAMNDRAVQWTLAGVLSGSTRLRDVLTGWVMAP